MQHVGWAKSLKQAGHRNIWRRRALLASALYLSSRSVGRARTRSRRTVRMRMSATSEAITSTISREFSILNLRIE